ncbi:MAG TPA: N-acetylglucosamine-6-phosphate deacetylase [Pseudolabrys sp.]|nr:N-acetylglucosamine-6-phosphate deacetylase [Pseudolabrys sp.]
MNSTPAAQARHAILAERLFDGRGWHEGAALLTEGGRIVALARQGDIAADCPTARLPAGTFLVPGFIDLQVNGGGGVLLNDAPSAEAMRAIALAHRKRGSTAIVPTLITDTRKQMQTAIVAARSVAGMDGVLGLHLEGPYLSPARPGIHRADRIAPAQMHDLDWLIELAGAGRSMITLAPECVPDGFVRALAAAGLRVAAGHSEASAEIVARAVDDGLTGVTHLYNAMPPLASRAPGLVGAALAEPRLTAGLIVDGLHVDPIAVRAAFAAKGGGGIALVSDAMPTVGATIDHFELMGRAISLADGKLTDENGTLAGAHLDMASAVRNAVKLAGIRLGDALAAATLTPARFLGIEADRGALVPGARADLVALTEALEVTTIWVDGNRN